jgi:hypothetical protein
MICISGLENTLQIVTNYRITCRNLKLTQEHICIILQRACLKNEIEAFIRKQWIEDEKTNKIHITVSRTGQHENFVICML